MLQGSRRSSSEFRDVILIINEAGFSLGARQIFAHTHTRKRWVPDVAAYKWGADKLMPTGVSRGSLTF